MHPYFPNKLLLFYCRFIPGSKRFLKQNEVELSVSGLLSCGKKSMG